MVGLALKTGDAASGGPPLSWLSGFLVASVLPVVASRTLRRLGFCRSPADSRQGSGHCALASCWYGVVTGLALFGLQRLSSLSPAACRSAAPRPMGIRSDRPALVRVGADRVRLRFEEFAFRALPLRVVQGALVIVIAYAYAYVYGASDMRHAVSVRPFAALFICACYAGSSFCARRLPGSQSDCAPATLSRGSRSPRIASWEPSPCSA